MIKFKKGFSLTECVVSIAITMIISVMVASGIVVVNKRYKTESENFFLSNEISNIYELIKNNDFHSENYNTETNQLILNYYNLTESYELMTQNNNITTITLKFNDNYNFDTTGKYSIILNISKENNYLKFNTSCLKNEKEISSSNISFHKELMI